MILDKEVEIIISFKNIQYYRRLGYNTKLNEKCTIKIDDVNINSHTLIHLDKNISLFFIYEDDWLKDKQKSIEYIKSRINKTGIKLNETIKLKNGEDDISYYLQNGYKIKRKKTPAQENRLDEFGRTHELYNAGYSFLTIIKI